MGGNSLMPLIYKMGASKILGILGICFGWLMPIFGIIFGIIGLSIPKEKGEESRDWTLNIVSLVEGILFWILWAIILWPYIGPNI